MCGIIGYYGQKHPKDILLEGLKKLEYRGYDSAGIAFKNNQEIQIIKSVGKISNLEEKLKDEERYNLILKVFPDAKSLIDEYKDLIK